jgi:hypothetical protein
MKTQGEILEAARALYGNLKADIANAHTRIEHIRITTLTQEAANLLTDLENHFQLESPAVLDSTGDQI